MKKKEITAVGIMTAIIFIVDRLAAIDGSLNTIKRIMDLNITKETFAVIQNTLHILSLICVCCFIFIVIRKIIKFQTELSEFNLKNATLSKTVLDNVAILNKSISEVNENLEKQYDYFRNDDSEIRTEFRKRDNELDFKVSEYKKEFDDLIESLKSVYYSMRFSATTTRLLITYLNELKDEDVISVSKILLDSGIQFTDLEAIGLNKKYIELLKAGYYTQKLAIHESNLSALIPETVDKSVEGTPNQEPANLS